MTGGEAELSSGTLCFVTRPKSSYSAVVFLVSASVTDPTSPRSPYRNVVVLPSGSVMVCGYPLES
jgi:hypothetical protein